MHKHVGYYLPDAEIRAIEIVHAKKGGHALCAKHHHGDVEDDINYKQVFYDRRDIS